MNRFLTATALLLAAATTAVAAPPAPKPVADFTLTDPAGKPWTLHGQKAKAVVVAFLSCDCPMSNGYLPTLADVAGKYADKGAVLVGVHADPDETAAQVRDHARQYKVPFPVVRDPGHAAVTALGATATPEVVVLDDHFAVRYRGRIDDAYTGRLKAKAIVTRHDLVAALDEVLAGKPVSVPETKAFGCPIPEPEAKPAAAGPAVTFYKDVLPILQTHCQGCHRAGQVGPFALTTYKDAAKWTDTCLEEVKAKRMPPWKPENSPLLAGERSLPPAAAATLERWVARGTPAGDPKDAPPARAFPEGWTLGEPDLVLEAPEESVIDAAGRDLFRVVVFPTNLPEDKYVVAMEVRPGNTRVVHHTLQVADTTGAARKLEAAARAHPPAGDKDRGPGYTVAMGWGFRPNPASFLGGWAPGLLPKPLPDGVGMRLPKGADVCVQFHYHRTGKVETDRTKVGLYFAKRPVTENLRTIAVPGRFLEIPAGEKAFAVDSSWRLTADVTAYRVTPHMHLLGKDIEMTVTPPGGTETTLVRVPAWDYNWQEQYQLKEPLRLPKGTVLRVRATYDNSADNPNNPHSPPKAVGVGEQTTNEMCFVFLGVSSASPGRLLISPVVGR